MKKKIKKEIVTIKRNNICKDISIPIKDRIYSSNKLYWCKKTTKSSADQLFKNIEQMKIDIKKRGLKPVVPPKKDWHIKFARALPIKNNRNFRADKHYIFNEKIGEYRMYTDDTIYGERKKIIFNKEIQHFTIKNLDKLRKKWNDYHEDKIKRDIDKDFDEFIKEEF